MACQVFFGIFSKCFIKTLLIDSLMCYNYYE